MSEKVRWGIIATGNIARAFAEALPYVEGARLQAVASRNLERAEAFGKTYEARRCYGSYRELAEDENVDAVYIATPHHLHAEDALMCLERGKAVLVEKPFTLNVRQARTVIDTARQRNLFCMEAMWTRFLPAVQKVRDLLEAEAIGQVRMVQADFGFASPFDPASRVYDPQLAGGALLDVGIYPLSLASMILGVPERIASLAEIGTTGVDEQNGIVLGYGGGELAVLSSGVKTRTHCEACIYGSAGSIRLHPRWFACEKITLRREGGDEQTFELPIDGSGYRYEIEETHRCLAEKRGESNVMPLSETLAIMKTLDDIRRQWGLLYPMEINLTPAHADRLNPRGHSVSPLE